MSVISTKDKQKVLAIAEDGTKVTGEMIDGWCEAYDNNRLPEGYAVATSASRKNVFTENNNRLPEGYTVATPGRPTLYGKKMSSITIRIPQVQKDALEHEAQMAGSSLSSYVRKIIIHR